MAGELILNEVASSGVSTPAASKDSLHQTNDTPSRLARKDSAGNILYMQEQYVISLAADFTLTNSTPLQKFFNSPTNGAITLPGSTAYRVQALYIITNTGTTSHQWQVAIGGTATFTSAALKAEGNSSTGAAPATGALQGWTSTVGTAVTVTAASTSATENVTILLDGVLRVNAGGTVIPQVGLTVATGTAATAKTNSFFALIPMGSNTVASLGPWT